MIIKSSAGMLHLINGMNVVVPFCVIEWDSKKLVYNPIYAAGSLMAAVDCVKEKLKEDPNINWDIKEDYNVPLKLIVNVGE